MKNKKGQGIFLNIIFVIFVWFAGILALPLLENVIDGARAGLNCAAPALISDGTKLMCLIVDTGAIALIWTVIMISIGILLGRSR